MYGERALAFLVGAAIASAMLTHPVPARATAADGPSASTALTEPFSMGYAVRGAVDPRSGGFSFELAMPGWRLRWDSAAVGVDRFGLGHGWMVADLAFLDVSGGVRVFPTAGGVFEADASAPSGLHGYPLDDIVFRREVGVLPPREDGTTAGSREYAFVLDELGGRRSYFDDQGRPVGWTTPVGARRDWVWADGRLVGLVDELGVVRRLDWSMDEVLVSSHVGRRADASTEAHASTNADASSGVARGSAIIELQHGRLSAVVDAEGGRLRVHAADGGLVTRVEAVSGAVTEAVWQTTTGGAASVHAVSVADGGTGEVIATRRWEASAGETRGGWPERPDVGPSSLTGDRSLTDGATRIVSAYENGRLRNRRTEVATPSGIVPVGEEAWRYDGAPPGSLAVAGARDRPTSVVVRAADETGAIGSRESTTQVAYDRYGRVTRHAEPGGLVTETIYDDVLGAGARLPVGLPRVVRRTAADGLIEETVSEFDATRTTPTVVERFEGRAEHALQRTARTESTVRADGWVAERREFPQGGTGDPVITRFDRVIDPSAATCTTTETTAAGTPAEVTTSQATDLITGIRTARTDETGRTERVELDGLGRPVERTDVDGRTTVTAYRTSQADGVNAIDELGSSGVTTTRTFDALGRLVQRADDIDGGAARPGHVRVIETLSYPDAFTVRVTDAWGATTTTRRDATGRVVAVVRPDGVTEATRYDDAARTITTGLTTTGDLRDAEATVTRQLDERGETVATSGFRADGGPVREVRRVVDGLGRERSFTDERGTTAWTLDEFGNPASAALAPAAPAAPGGGQVVAERAFDAYGESVEKTLTSGDEARSGGRRVLDARGRTVAEVDQTGAITSYELTADGLVLTETTPYGRVTSNSYDPQHRRLVETRTTSPIGDTVHRALEYDDATGGLTAVYDPRDRTTTEITRTFDAFGNVTTTRYPDGSLLRHEYDAHGRKVATRDIAGSATRFSYDRAGRLSEAVRRDSAGTELARVAYRYDALGRVARLDRGNGAATSLTYTSLGQPETERTDGPGGVLVSERDYRYDAGGNVVAASERVAPASGGEPSRRRVEYRYDAHARLVESVLFGEADASPADPAQPEASASPESPGSSDASVPPEASASPAERRTHYRLSVAGDVIEQTEATRASTVPERRRQFEYGPTGALLAITEDGQRAELAYDAAGNLVRDLDGTTYRYDAGNRPVAETSIGGATTATSYWADGRRAALAAGTGATTFYWDADQVVNEAHELDGVRATAGYLIGDRRLARTIDTRGAGATRYLVHDRHGSVTELLDADGEVMTRYTYGDYGAVQVDSADEPGAPVVGDVRRNPFQYSGEQTDPSGLQHLRARTYAVELMRFTTEDETAKFNLYWYGDANPIMMVDPTGRSSEGDMSDVKNAPWFKIMTTALSVALMIVGFLSITTMSPAMAAVTMYAVGHWGGIASSVVQAGGVALLAVDAINALLDEPFMNPSDAGTVWIAGTVLSLAGSVAGGVFKMVRSRGWKLVEEAEELRAKAEKALATTADDLAVANKNLTAKLGSTTDELAALKARQSVIEVENAQLRTRLAELEGKLTSMSTSTAPRAADDLLVAQY